MNLNGDNLNFKILGTGLRARKTLQGFGGVGGFRRNRDLHGFQGLNNIFQGLNNFQCLHAVLGQNPGDLGHDFRLDYRQGSGCRFPDGLRKGLSLLEVILAIAILGGAMVVLTQLINIGHRAAMDARDLSEAQILCDAKISEVSAGVLPTNTVNGAEIVEAPGWQYSLSVDKAAIDGLLVVDCTVSQDPSQFQAPVSFRLVRWIPDPDYEAELKALDEAEAEE